MIGKNLSQRELAGRSKVSAATINNYIHGNRDPGAKELESIAQVLGVSMGFLYSGDDPLAEFQGKSQTSVRMAVKTPAVEKAAEGLMKKHRRNKQ